PDLPERRTERSIRRWVLTTYCKRSGLATAFPGQPGLLSQASSFKGEVVDHLLVPFLDFQLLDVKAVFISDS
ncbi:hypothetical protein, partial [Vreelandella rituensis]|uniref:hypothetical protein n=1 Tax=Vreelandella rituensis TaxID=2282306 RepID=UPI0039EFED5D